MKLFVAALALVALWTGPPAHADGHADVAPSNTDFIVSAVEADAESTSSITNVAQTADPIVDTFSGPACAVGGSQTCDQLATCDDGTNMVTTTYVTASGVMIDGGNNCPENQVAPAAAPTVTPGMVAAAFRRIPLPASELMVQPPGGRTLVNFETNFYTEGGEFRRTVTLLGRRVVLRIWPASFGWRFGDGETRQTTEPGARYPDLEVTHRYLSRGWVSPSVDTTYAAEFRVGDGPWRAVNGTVTIPGTPQGLRVVTARPVLVGS